MTIMSEMPKEEICSQVLSLLPYLAREDVTKIKEEIMRVQSIHDIHDRARIGGEECGKRYYIARAEEIEWYVFKQQFYDGAEVARRRSK